MAEIVNLNRFRKDRARSEKRAQADANAAKFGRSASERAKDKARVEKSTRDHDQLRLDPRPDLGPPPEADSDREPDPDTGPGKT